MPLLVRSSCLRSGPQSLELETEHVLEKAIREVLAHQLTTLGVCIRMIKYRLDGKAECEMRVIRSQDEDKELEG